MTLNKIYEPGEDSYLLQKYVDQYSKVDSVLDMGTGTGIQGLTASKYATNVLSVDVNPEAVKQTKTLIEIEKKKNIKILESDLFSKIPKQKFDLIIFNPPYLPKHKHVDNIALVSGKRGVDTTLKFMDNVNEYLMDPPNTFGNSFCKNCGSRVPRFSSGRGAMMVPIGSTMDSPEIEPTLVCLEDHTDWFTDLEKLLR